VVVLLSEVDLLQQVLELFLAAVHVANKDEALPLLREILLRHVLDLDHVLELVAHIASVTHGRRFVHEAQLLLERRMSRSEISPPADEEQKCGGNEGERGALDASRQPVDLVLPLDGDQEVVVSAVEAVLLVGHIEKLAVVGYEVDEWSVALWHVWIIAVVRHRSGDPRGRDAWVDRGVRVSTRWCWRRETAQTCRVREAAGLRASEGERVLCLLRSYAIRMCLVLVAEVALDVTAHITEVAEVTSAAT
jgi:hypothetical protein